jgi:hypothetical protein
MKMRIRKQFIKRNIICLAFICLFISGCATYYEQTQKFQRYYAKEEFQKAEEILDKSEPGKDSTTRLLYLLQKGIVNFMQNRYKESNDYFEQAYLYIEDLQKNYVTGAISLLTNPTVRPYRGEDFEVVLIHYYKAINYLNLKLYDEALVECRRLNLKLNQINDKYATKKNRYKTDAFALYLMGMIYEAASDYNNAFIAYRNAYTAYSSIYEKDFSVEVPVQLKKDLVRLSYLNGFYEELEEYRNKFKMDFDPHSVEGKGEVVVFWQNGLGPVKDEWSLNFVIVKGKDGSITFVNESLGISIPFHSGSSGTSSLKDIKIIRVAFPKYVERKPYYTTASITNGGNLYNFEMAENINEIAFKTLEDRMLRELGEGLLRFALKQAGEEAAREVDEGLGLLFSIVNAATERADTRNWQTLPYGIYISRFPLDPGQTTITVSFSASRKSRDKTMQYTIDCREGETVFLVIHTLDSRLSP